MLVGGRRSVSSNLTLPGNGRTFMQVMPRVGVMVGVEEIRKALASSKLCGVLT